MPLLSLSFKDSWTNGTFLRNRVSGNEPCVFQYDLENKRQGLQWFSPNPRITYNTDILKSQPMTRKDWFLWHQGLCSCRIHSWGQTIHQAYGEIPKSEILSIAERGDFSSRNECHMLNIGSVNKAPVMLVFLPPWCGWGTSSGYLLCSWAHCLFQLLLQWPAWHKVSPTWPYLIQAALHFSHFLLLRRKNYSTAPLWKVSGGLQIKATKAD